MVLCKAVKDYLKEGGTTNIEIDDFLDFYSWLSKGKKKIHRTSVTAFGQN